jgi:membrane protease YdiL (CAAX protease family)
VSLILYAILAVALLLIARGIPLRDAFALRRPVSWRRAWLLAGGALAATYAVSFAEVIVLGSGSREQTVPQFWDAARIAPFIANALVVAGVVPLVEEAACRGIGFRLMENYGQRVAIVVTAVAFALAHGAVVDLPILLVVGLGLGYLRAKSGSLYPVVALHGVVNGVAILTSALVSAS